MKILVTGGCGFIGSVTVRHLKNLGYNVLVYDNLIKGHKNSLPNGVIFIEGELSDKEKLKKILEDYRIDTIVHFAAFIEAGESVHKPAKYFENNVINTLILLEAMLEAGVKKIVFSSSAAVYGTPRKIPIDENAELNPESPYGETKLLMEYLLKEFVNNYGFKAVALRYFNAAGALHDCGEDHHPETHIIPRFIKAGLKGENITIFGDGSHRRDYIHIEDLAKAHILAVELLKKETFNEENNQEETNQGFFEYFNLGNGKRYSNIEIADKILELIKNKTGKNSESKIIHLDARPGDPKDLLASNNKAKEYLGWIPERSDIENILSDALNWHLNYQQGFNEDFNEKRKISEINDLEIVEKIVSKLKESNYVSRNFKHKLLRILLKDEINTIRLIDNKEANHKETNYKEMSDQEILNLLKDFFPEKNNICNILIKELEILNG